MKNIFKILILMMIIAIPLSFSITYGTEFNFQNVVNEVFLNTDENSIVNQSATARQQVRVIGERNVLATSGTYISSGTYIPLDSHTQMSEQFAKEIFCGQHNKHVARVDQTWIRVANITFNDPDYTTYASEYNMSSDVHKTNDASDIQPGQTKEVPKTKYPLEGYFPINQNVIPENYYGNITVSDDAYGLTQYTSSPVRTLKDDIRAYIYAEMGGMPGISENGNELTSKSQYPSYVQLAIWRTDDNDSSDNGEGDAKSPEVEAMADALYAEAEEFEKYIKDKLNPSLSRGEPKETLDEATVTYNKDGYFLLGPFSISYLRAFTHVEGREFVDFSGMTNVTLTGDAGTISNWEFFYENPKQTMQGDRSDYNFPYSGEVFYIKIPQTSEISRHKKLVSVTFQFEDMHAEAYTYKMTGNFGTGLSAEIVQKDVNWCTGGKDKRHNLCETCSTARESSSHTFTHYYDFCTQCNNKRYVNLEQCGVLNGYYVYSYQNRYYYVQREGNGDEEKYYIYYCSGHRLNCGGVEFCNCTSLYGGPSFEGHYREKYYVIQTSVSGTKTAQDLYNVVYARRYMIIRELKITAEYIPGEIPEEWPLVILEIAGKVWLDGYETKAAEIDGFINEPGVKGVKVTLYKSSGGIGTYTHGGQITTYTDSNGNYSFEEVPMNEYYLEFIYDGQTYKATTPLASSGQIPSNGIEASNSADWKRNSKATENESERQAFNRKFETITKGKTQTGINLKYDTSISRTSKIQTRNPSTNIPFEEYEMRATSKELGLYIPIDELCHMYGYEKIIDGQTYYRIYKYMPYMNFGLIQRRESDFALKKDVTYAAVTINEKGHIINYNSRNIGLNDSEDSFEVAAKSNSNYLNITYNLPIYASDYYFRIEDYSNQNALNSHLTSEEIALIQKNKNYQDYGIGITSEDRELKVFVKYKIVISNSSENYYGTIDRLVDYFDPTYTLVNRDIRIPIQNIDKTSPALQIVASGSTWKTNSGSGNVTWTMGGTNNGYQTMYTDSLKNVVLASGEKVQIEVTFEVKKSLQNGLPDSIMLGEKKNVTEIYAYSTYNNSTCTDVAGRIDRDSQPGNAVPGRVNTYEDDTDEAPILEIYLRKNERILDGLVWEDSRKTLISQTGQLVGDGIREDSESLINGVKVQLIEVVTVNGMDYEYIWREMESGSTQFKYIDYGGEITTSGTGNGTVLRENVTYNGNATGKYKFNGFAAGNYFIRFKYGDPDSETADIKYNGQDYKSTTYQKGFNTVESEWYELEKYPELENAKVSDARDNEARRLEVIAYSKLIKNSNATVLSSGDRSGNYYNTAYHQELKENTYMHADTGKLKIQVEYNTEEEDRGTNKNENEYYIKNLDFGLENRPHTDIRMEKEVGKIVITASNGTVLIDTTDKNRIKNVNANWTEEGRLGELTDTFIYIDETELQQGLSIQIDYNLKIRNEGEIDTVSSRIADGQTNNIVDELVTLRETHGINSQQYKAKVNEIKNMISERNNGSGYYHGYYVGTTYYSGQYGTRREDNVLVTTTVDHVIDYVDNSIVFRKEENEQWMLMEVPNNTQVTANPNDNHIITLKEMQDRGLLAKDLKFTIKNSEQKDEPITQLVVTESMAIPVLIPRIAVEQYHQDGIYEADLFLTLSKQAAQGNETQDDLTFYNVAEILQYRNTAGRRDPNAIPGNQDIGQAIIEEDADDTQQVIILPPYGNTEQYDNNLVNIVSIVSFIVIAVAVVITIKLTVGRKKE